MAKTLLARWQANFWAGLAIVLPAAISFAVLIWLSRRGRDVETLADLKGLGRTDPPAAYVMLVFMLSLGGIPPTMGFLGKWFIFYAALQAGQAWLAITPLPGLLGRELNTIGCWLTVVKST